MYQYSKSVVKISPNDNLEGLRSFCLQVVDLWHKNHPPCVETSVSRDKVENREMAETQTEAEDLTIDEETNHDPRKRFKGEEAEEN